MTTNVNLGFVAAAGGTVDVITATYSPAPSALVDKMLLWFRATGANTSTTPTFSPNGLTARTIVKQGGAALVAGDIPGANAIMEVVYDLANTRWELLNPRYEAFIGTYTTVQIAALVGMTERQIVYNTDDNDYEFYDGTRWVKMAHPKYKLYVATLNIAAGPTVVGVVRENNLGTITFSYIAAGTYGVTATGLLTVGKTRITLKPCNGDVAPEVPFFNVNGVALNGFSIRAYDLSSGTPAANDGYTDNLTLEIQVDY